MPGAYARGIHNTYKDLLHLYNSFVSKPLRISSLVYRFSHHRAINLTSYYRREGPINDHPALRLLQHAIML